MNRINYGRVLGGGLLAGLVLNIGEYLLNLILGEEWAQAAASLGVAEPGASEIARYVVLTFLIGIALVWLYAAIRPRFGPGPGTAFKAALAVWFLGWLMPAGFFETMGIFPSKLFYVSIVWGLIEVPVASLAGAWLYQEGSEAA